MTILILCKRWIRVSIFKTCAYFTTTSWSKEGYTVLERQTGNDNNKKEKLKSFKALIMPGLGNSVTSLYALLGWGKLEEIGS